MSIIVNIGMWFERFVIIVTSVYRDYLPVSWSTIIPHQSGRSDFTWEHLDYSLPVISCSLNTSRLLPLLKSNIF